MKKSSLLLALCLITLSIVFYISQPTSIVKTTDYEQFLTGDHLTKAQEENAGQIEFWENKLAGDSNNFVYQKKLAGLYASAFKISGDATLLHRSDSLLQNINTRIPGQVGVLQSLALNAITRHAFREAEKYINEAYEIGDQKMVSTLIKTDVLLERGGFMQADQLLRDISSKTHFDYLIRAVKLYDQSGDLGKAIESMEKAALVAKASGNPDLVNWSLSNLADMYGHDGRIKKSYDAYLEALTYNPADLHSLKGIAWIAFSHDKNTAASERILSFLQDIHPVPDYDLLLADLATFEGDIEKASQYEASFIAHASLPKYGNMYKSYLCLLNSLDEPSSSEAMKIAQQEVVERPQNAAVDILNKYVIDQTEEPEALYHTGIIFKESGHPKEARKYLKAALDASFELDPLVTADIKHKLRQL